MLLLIASSLGLERSGDSLHRLLQYPQADEEALPSSVPPPQGEGVGLEREGNSEDRFVIKTTNLFQPSTPGAQNHRKTGQNQPRKHSGNRNAAADREQNSVGGALAPHSHDRSQPPGKAVQYATKYLRRRGDARVDEAKREGIVRHDEGVHRRGQHAAPGAHSGSQKHHNPHSNEPSGLSNVKHAHGPTSSTGRATHGPSHPHGPAKSKRHRRFSDAEFFEKRLPEQRDRMEPPSDDVADALAQNSAVGVSSAEAEAEASAATKEADEKAAAEAKERAVPGWADNIEAAGETKESKVPLGTMQHPWDGDGWQQEGTIAFTHEDVSYLGVACESLSSNSTAGLAWACLRQKRLPEQRDRMEPPSDDVADALAQNSAVGVSSAEANAEASAATKEADEKAAAEAKERAVPGWADNIEAAGETKESKVPLGTMQHPWDGNGWAQEAQEEGSQEGQAATASTELSEKRLPPQPPMDGEVADSVDTALPGSARAAAENTEENSDPNADAKSAGEWEMPGETKESSVPLGTMQNPTTEEEAAASEMAATEAMAAGEKTEEKAEAEAGAENEAGWEMAGETKESEVPLGTMQNPAADVTEGESRVADAIAQNSAVGVSSAEANAESSAATKEADKKAEKEAKERAVPGWADNIEAAGETKESKVPLGTMQQPWDGNGWQESPSR